MIKLLVDGVVFQSDDGLHRSRWHAILSCLQRDGRIALTVLDRGRLPDLPGAVSVPFPSWAECDRAADSRQIQLICDEAGIDVVLTTGDTTPLATPMLLVLDDLTPDVLSGGSSERGLTISFAQRYLCMAECVLSDLLALYPAIAPARARVARYGIDHELFFVRGDDEVAEFRRRRGIDGPYVVFGGAAIECLTGDREDVARVLSAIVDIGIEIVCIGAAAPPGVPSRPLGSEAATDRALAYTGAIAAVDWPVDGGCPPSLVEALACGCPLVTGATQAAEWACAPAVLQIGRNVAGSLLDADLKTLAKLVGPQGAARRDAMRRDGLVQASRFQWDSFADALVQALVQLVDERRRGLYDAFFAEWARLRRIQANVDFPA